MPGQRLGGRQRVRASRPDGDDPVVRLDQIAVARQEERQPDVHHDEHGLEASQHAVGAPVFRELDGGPLEIAAILFELGFEAREQCKGVRGRAREPSQDAIVVQLADLASGLLDHGVAEGDLTVARHDGFVTMPNRQDRRRVKVVS